MAVEFKISFLGTVLNEAMRLNGYKDAWYNVDDQYWNKALKNLGIE